MLTLGVQERKDTAQLLYKCVITDWCFACWFDP